MTEGEAERIRRDEQPLVEEVARRQEMWRSAWAAALRQTQQSGSSDTPSVEWGAVSSRRLAAEGQDVHRQWRQRIEEQQHNG